MTFQPILKPSVVVARTGNQSFRLFLHLRLCFSSLEVALVSHRADCPITARRHEQIWRALWQRPNSCCVLVWLQHAMLRRRTLSAVFAPCSCSFSMELVGHLVSGRNPPATGSLFESKRESDKCAFRFPTGGRASSG